MKKIIKNIFYRTTPVADAYYFSKIYIVYYRIREETKISPFRFLAKQC